MKLAERPRLLAFVLAAATALGGVAIVKVATEPTERARRVRQPAPAHMCPSAVTAWGAEQDRLDALYEAD